MSQCTEEISIRCLEIFCPCQNYLKAPRSNFMTFTRQANTGYQTYLPEANNVIDYCFRLKLDYPRLLFQGKKSLVYYTTQGIRCQVQGKYIVLDLRSISIGAIAVLGILKIIHLYGKKLTKFRLVFLLKKHVFGVVPKLQ